MIDKRFPLWDVDVENGTIYSLRTNKYLGSVNKYSDYVLVGVYGDYKQSALHQYIWMVANGCDIPEGYDIHHIDGNKQNNSIHNLELMEHTEHMSFTHTGNKYNLGKKHSKEWNNKMSSVMRNHPNTSIKIAQYTLDDELVKVWDSINECGRNGFNAGHISSCCKLKRKQHKGFKWKYLNNGTQYE